MSSAALSSALCLLLFSSNISHLDVVMAKNKKHVTSTITIEASYNIKEKMVIGSKKEKRNQTKFA